MTQFPPANCFLIVLIGSFIALLPSRGTAAEQAPPALPPCPIGTLLGPATSISNQPVRTSGTVTLTLYSGACLFLQDGTGAIEAEGTANDQVHVGDQVEAIGTLQRTGYSRTLRNCTFAARGRGQRITPRLSTGLQLKGGGLDMQLVRAQGTLLRDPILRPDGEVLEIRVDHTFVTLLAPGVAETALSQLRPGSLLQATGVCSVGPDRQGKPDWIRIYLRPMDIVLLHGPPWWTPERTSLVSGLITAVALAGAGGMALVRHKELNRALEKRVREGTAELRERTAELERVNQELEAFSYSVSHDLRAPLRAMAGFARALDEEYDRLLDVTGKTYLKRIGDAAAQMNRLIDDLLSLANVTRNELRREPINLSEIAETVVEEVRHGHPNPPVNAVVQPGMVDSADRNLVRIIFTNLLQNAWKFSRKTPHPTVEVGRLASGTTAVYYVRDNGAGFDPAHAKRLFQAFQRLHSPTEFEGTGIGLAIVQKAVRRHSGRIWAEGKVNQGACFFFTLKSEED